MKYCKTGKDFKVMDLLQYKEQAHQGANLAKIIFRN